MSGNITSAPVDSVQLPPLEAAPYAIDYSQDHPPAPGDAPVNDPPRVWAICLQNLATGGQTIIDAHCFELNLDAREVREDLDLMEEGILSRFAAFVRQRPSVQFVRWHMSRPTFGFDVLRRRALRYNITLPDVPKWDLQNHLKVKYGDGHFGGHPYLTRALENNGLSTDGILDQEQATAAAAMGRHDALGRKLSAKTAGIAHLYHAVRLGTYRTADAAGQAKPEAAPAGLPPDPYAPAGELWPRYGFLDYKDFKRWLKASNVRHEQRGQRRMVHAADLARAIAERDRKADEAMGIANDVLGGVNERADAIRRKK